MCSGQWDMGHLQDQKYSDAYDRFLRGKMSEQEFLEWYRTAENYEPQTIPFNRGHKEGMIKTKRTSGNVIR